MFARPRTISLFTLLVMLNVSGCMDAGLSVELYPVAGTVIRNGKPVKGGGMMLVPEGSLPSGVSINASVNPDGTFKAETLHTKSNGRTVGTPGVPAGKYRVIYHPPSDGSRMGLEMELKEPITVEAKPNTIEITLPNVAPVGVGEVRDETPPIANPNADVKPE